MSNIRCMMTCLPQFRPLPSIFSKGDKVVFTPPNMDLKIIGEFQGYLDDTNREARISNIEGIIDVQYISHLEDEKNEDVQYISHFENEEN